MRSLFEQHRDRPWIFLRNLGNWGDILLFTGAEILATRAGVQWTSYETPEFENLEITDEHCIYLQGGGGFNDWSSGRAFVNLQLASERPAHLVVQGPMTVGGESAWLSRRLAECTARLACKELRFFAREHYTLDFLRTTGMQSAGIALHIDHDTALAYSADDLLELADLRSMPTGKYELIVAREDPEQPGKGGARRPGNSMQRSIVLDPAYEANSFRHWLRMHLFARSIVTNRLHSSIVGKIAGKPVTLSPGSYHKNRSVWEFSLKGSGPVWADNMPPVRSTWQRLPERLRDSYKLRRARLWLRGVPID